MNTVDCKLKNASNLDELFEMIVNQLSMGYCSSPFYDGQLQKDTIDELEHLLRLNKMKFWTIDSQATRSYDHHESSHPENFGNIQRTGQRAYLCGFMPRYLVDHFAQEVSKLGKFVGIYDHLNSDETRLYQSGVPKKWKTTDDVKMEDFVVKYHLWYTKDGNPFIKPYKHIYDYGSEIDELEGYFEKKELEEEFMKHYVEIAVIESTFDQTGPDSLFKTCADILEELKKNDWKM